MPDQLIELIEQQACANVRERVGSLEPVMTTAAVAESPRSPV
jgi:hypothetical protein